MIRRTGSSQLNQYLTNEYRGEAGEREEVRHGEEEERSEVWRGKGRTEGGGVRYRMGR